MRIFLTGFMGSGKTTVGELLAARLDVPFVDLDHEIERASGCSITEIFHRGGEPLFRRLEHEALAAVAGGPAAVVATGGGTLTIEQNLGLLHESGITVWLNPPFSVIAGRIGSLGKADRPMFRDEAQALALYRSRLPFYRRADVEIGIQPEEAPAEIAARAALLLAGSAGSG